MIISENSPLRNPPSNLSRKQVLILDGIRYAAEVTDVAYERLYKKLQDIASSPDQPSCRDIAMAVADAWTIIDSSHRFHELINGMPGLKKGVWFKQQEKGLKDALKLRDNIQHLPGEINNLIKSNEQIWGYLSWAEVKNRSYTGKWLLISPGAVYKNQKFSFIGPQSLPYPVPLGHIRLNAFGSKVYLGRLVKCIHKSIIHLSEEIRNNNVRTFQNSAHDLSGADLVYEGYIEIAYKKK